jgi:hypothetical protein
MKALALAMLACVWCGVSAAQGERSAAEGYTAYWLTSEEPRAYEDLILARRPLSEMPRGAAAADTSLLTCEGVLVTTYQKDSIWNVDRRPFKPVAGVEKVLKDSITMNGREFRYAQADLRDVLRLLENPEGTIPIHRIYGPVSGQEDIALELARAIRRQLAAQKRVTRLSSG